MFSVFLQGLALSLGLIVAIGAQNAFVLRQGLRREHVASVVLFCAMADAFLISAGVLGMAHALGERPALARGLALAGAAFLLLYGVQALRRARHSHQLRASAGGEGMSRVAALAQAAAFTLLNPHVYLDTVLLVGSIGAQQAAGLRGWFVAGASSASLFWFYRAGFWCAVAGAVVCAARGVARAGRPDRRDDACAGRAAAASRRGRALIGAPLAAREAAGRYARAVTVRPTGFPGGSACGSRPATSTTHVPEP